MGSYTGEVGVLVFEITQNVSSISMKDLKLYTMINHEPDIYLIGEPSSKQFSFHKKPIFTVFANTTAI